MMMMMIELIQETIITCITNARTSPYHIHKSTFIRANSKRNARIYCRLIEILFFLFASALLPSFNENMFQALSDQFIDMKNGLKRSGLDRDIEYLRVREK